MSPKKNNEKQAKKFVFTKILKINFLLFCISQKKIQNNILIIKNIT